MRKTKLMLKAEKKIGESIETYLNRRYHDDFMASTYLKDELVVSRITVCRWLSKLNIEIRSNRDYFERRIKYPKKGALTYCYNYLRIPVRKIAEERGVHKKTVYRWMEKEGIKRRHGTDAYLRNGCTKPTDEELEKLCEEKKTIEIASIYGVWPDTIDRWKQKAELFNHGKSKYDKKRVRKMSIDDIISKTGKNLLELTFDDFKKTKQQNGKSYRGLLYWYLAHYGYNFSQTKNHFVREFYNSK